MAEPGQELYSLLVPIADDRLIVPRVCVAEVTGLGQLTLRALDVTRSGPGHRPRQTNLGSRRGLGERDRGHLFGEIEVGRRDRVAVRIEARVPHARGEVLRFRWRRRVLSALGFFLAAGAAPGEAAFLASKGKRDAVTDVEVFDAVG